MSTNVKIIAVVLIVLASCGDCHKGEIHSHSRLNTTKTHKENRNKMEIKKPYRVSHTFVQTINGTIKEIMPLYCPVREQDWIENWKPIVVYSNSGLVETDCVFITEHGSREVVWIVTDYNVETGHVEMFYHVPGILVTKLEIKVEEIAVEKASVTLTYSKTSLGVTGDKVLKDFTKEHFDVMMHSWEKAMNHYIKTGQMLTGLPNF